MDEQELAKQLKKKSPNVDITDRISSNEEFPEYFVGFKLQSIKAVGQKFRKFVVDNDVIFANIENGKMNVRNMKKKDRKKRLKLFQNFIFFAQKNIDIELSKFTAQEALNETVLDEIS